MNKLHKLNILLELFIFILIFKFKILNINQYLIS
jgi:hypothetical protein